MKTTSSNHQHCQELLERLSRYIDDELPQADRLRIEQHLRDCPCCEDVLHSLEHTVDICHEEGRPRMPAAVRERALQRVHALLAERPAARPRRPSRASKGRTA